MKAHNDKDMYDSILYEDRDKGDINCEFCSAETVSITCNPIQLNSIFNLAVWKELESTDEIISIGILFMTDIVENPGHLNTSIGDVNTLKLTAKWAMVMMYVPKLMEWLLHGRKVT